MGSFLTTATGTGNNFQAANPYNVGASMATEQANQGQIYGQQQQLAQALQQQAAGQGPNPAQAQFQQNTEQNLENAAGSLASQRGLDPALAAKMAAQGQATGAQQAAGQAAVTQAQQQLAAQSQLAGLYGQEGTQNIQQQGLITGAQQGVNTVNSGVAQQNTTQAQNLAGGALSATGAGGASALSGANVGNIATAAAGAYDGGEISPHMKVMSDIYHKDFRSGGKVPGTAPMKGDHPENDIVDAKLSPGEVVIPKSVMESKDPVGEAQKFVAGLVAKKAKDSGDFKEALKRHVAGRKNK